MPPMTIQDNNAADLSQDFALLESEEGNSQVITEEKAPETEVKKVEKPVKKEEKPEVDDVDKVLEELEGFESASSETEDETEVAPNDPEELLPHQRPTIEAINKKFPNFFKEFPGTKNIWFREKQFSELFHTPAEARVAAESAEVYRSLQDDIVNGTGEKLIPALKESDSLDKFASNFLPNLFKTDKDLHYKTILPILEDSVRAAFREAKRIGGDSGENLKNAALVLSNFLFGDMEVAEGKRTFVEASSDKKDTKVSEERKAWEAERYNNFNIDVNEKIFNSLSTDINSGFKQTDNLTKFMKDSISEQVIKKVVATVRADKLHMKYMDRLWQEAKANGYKETDKTRIYNASLARAKSLIPSIRRQLIAEAIGSSPSEQQRRSTVVDQQKSRREPGASGSVPNTQPKQPSSKRINWKKTSDVDFLNDKYTLK